MSPNFLTSFNPGASIAGTELNDFLNGTPTAEAIDGGTGNDVITGFQGNDTLTGGPEADTFVFRPGDGNDLITDFILGTDALVLDGLTIDAVSEVDANGDLITDTVVDLSSGETIVLAGVIGITDPGDLLL